MGKMHDALRASSYNLLEAPAVLLSPKVFRIIPNTQMKLFSIPPGHDAAGL
jgi:hypothetical protein